MADTPDVSSLMSRTVEEDSATSVIWPMTP